MKKLLFTLLLTLFSLALIAQERELSNYEKYRIEKDKQLYETPDTTKVDTVYVVVEQESEPLIINNYYRDYDEPNYRFLLTFGCRYLYYYQPYYSYYDPFYYDYWYTPNYYYNYWGHNTYYNRYYNYWGYNTYYNRYYSRPHGQRYAASSSLGWNKNYYRPYNKTYSSGYIYQPTPRPRTIGSASKTYVPTYNKPRSTRSGYNIGNKTEVSTQTRTYTRPSSNTTTNTEIRTTNIKSSTYSTPTRSQNYRSPTIAPSNTTPRSYSQPTRTQIHSAPSYSRTAPTIAPSRSYSQPTRSAGSSTGASSSRSAGRR